MKRLGLCLLMAPFFFACSDSTAPEVADQDIPSPQFSVAALDGVSDLILQVEALWADGVLNDGQANSMLQKLAGTRIAIQNDRPSAANKLSAFVNEVEGYINGGNLAPELGQTLIAAANPLIRWLEGGTCPICGGAVCLPPCPNAL